MEAEAGAALSEVSSLDALSSMGLDDDADVGTLSEPAGKSVAMLDDEVCCNTH